MKYDNEITMKQIITYYLIITLLSYITLVQLHYYTNTAPHYKSININTKRGVVMFLVTNILN